MLSGKLTCFLLLFSAVFSENIAHNSILLKLINFTQSANQRINVQGPERSRFQSLPEFVGQAQVRFTDRAMNDSTNDDQMEAPAPKFSFFNFLNGDEEDREEDDTDEEDDDEKLKEEDDYNDEDDFNFFGDSDEIAADRLEGTNKESLLKQRYRRRLRLHNLILPLLMAYKLKFFTVVPLLLGSLVLLVGTTGIAGFFFALFAAALGLHVKASHDHEN